MDHRTVSSDIKGPVPGIITRYKVDQVMSDMGDRDRGRYSGRRRRPRGGPPSRKERDYDVDSPQQSSRPTIILAKHPESTEQHTSSVSRASSSTSPAPSNRQQEKPVMVLRSRDESSRGLTPATSLPSIPVSTMQGETPPQQTYLQRHDVSSKLSGHQEMSRCIKLIDEHQQWVETASDMLLDQTDFLVVGVLGLQGSGKSTIMSLLAGNTETDPARSFIFPAQSRDIKIECGHMTNGIDIYVTSQRIILLDTQPLLSASVLDQLIHNEKKIPPEYTTAENYAEVMGLQYITFLLTVCNVVLVVQDWFTDSALLQILTTAEMLKPATPSTGHDSSTGQDDQPDYYPHLVFVQNKAGREDFSVENFTSMQKALSGIFANSKLKMKGDVSMATGRQTFGLNPAYIKSDFNLFVLPSFEGKASVNSDSILTMLPEYRGYPSFTTLINSLRSQIFSMPREPHTHTTLSEKNWFHYAARIWDSIKKSQLIGEYNRLLP